MKRERLTCCPLIHNIFYITLLTSVIFGVFSFVLCNVKDTAARKLYRCQMRKRWGRKRGKEDTSPPPSFFPLTFYSTKNERRLRLQNSAEILALDAHATDLTYDPKCFSNFFPTWLANQTTAHLSRHSWHIFKPWCTDWGPEQGFWRWLEDVFNQGAVSLVVSGCFLRLVIV